MRRDLYPDNWNEISLRIRSERAGWRCEWCGAEHGKPHPVTGSKVCLTVAHLDTPFPDGTPGNRHNKMDVRDEALAALCNRCHLNYDRPDHVRNARETRRRKREKDGQLRLLSVPI